MNARRGSIAALAAVAMVVSTAPFGKTTAAQADDERDQASALPPEVQLRVDRGLKYLADLQKSDGIWPKIPFRRMPADPSVSAFVLYQLGDDARFRATVRIDDAVKFFQTHESSLDTEARRLWQRARLRCGVRPTRELMLVWS